MFGTVDGLGASPEVVKRALKLNAAAVILAHKPSERRRGPSHADELITEIRDALALVASACSITDRRRDRVVSLPKGTVI